MIFLLFCFLCLSTHSLALLAQKPIRGSSPVVEPVDGDILPSGMVIYFNLILIHFAFVSVCVLLLSCVEFECVCVGLEGRWLLHFLSFGREHAQRRAVDFHAPLHFIWAQLFLHLFVLQSHFCHFVGTLCLCVSGVLDFRVRIAVGQNRRPS